VTAWAVEGDLDPAAARSNTFPLEWPPRSGQFIEVAEMDRVAWFSLDEARRRIGDAERPLIDRLVGVVDADPPDPARADPTATMS
jgi:predicted NUDIX family NTP pyrophosphohydrolase